VPGVAGAAPAVYGKALLSSPTGAAAVTLKGIVPAEERTVTDVVAKVVEGSASALGAAGDGPPPILLGKALADSLNVGPGDVVTLTSPRGRLSPVGLLPRVSKVRVVGTVKTGLYEFDAGWGYLPSRPPGASSTTRDARRTSRCGSTTCSRSSRGRGTSWPPSATAT